MPSERVIWGPPGTGKTTAGITLAKTWTDQGVASNGIAYLAFTKAAAKAAALQIFETEDDTRMGQEFPYFRTIHSLCYLGLRKNKPDLRLISTGDMKHFAKHEGMDGVYGVYDWEDLADVYAKLPDHGRTEWDTALAAYTFSRVKATSIADMDKARLMPAPEAALMLGAIDLGLDIYRAFVEKYERYKTSNGLIDFTDMLEYGVREMPPFTDIRYVVLDECQDLAPVHHLLVDKLLQHSEEIWWIGDDDQSIFKFSGASAELFLERAKRSQYQIQLRQTNRFGQEIVDFSKKIIERVAHRHPKEIVGVAGQAGSVEVSGQFEPVSGDVIILHRHVQGCENIARQYMEAGLPFRNERGLDPLDSTKRIKAWQAIQELSKGEPVTSAAAALLVEEFIPMTSMGEGNQRIRLVIHGSKSKLDETLKGPVNLRDLVQAKVLTSEGASVIQDKAYHTLRVGLNDFQYFDRLHKNGYNLDTLDKIPRITTIHGAKGRQAKRAIVFSEMGNKCWEDYETEHRLAYVAATRTKTILTICVENTVHWAKDMYDYPVDERVAK